MQGPGGPGQGEIDPPTREPAPERVDVNAEELREQREEDARIAELEARVAQLEGLLASAREALRASERRHEIERAAREADAHDTETVALLTEIAVGAMDEPDVRLAVEELRRDKPFLFRPAARRTHAAGSMSASVDRGPTLGAELGTLADEARASGDRGALLTYLRERRGV